MAAAGQLEGAWGNLPFDAAAAVVATLTSLPSHQAQAAFTALRLTSRHWRHGERGGARPDVSGLLAAALAGHANLDPVESARGLEMASPVLVPHAPWCSCG